LKNSKHKEKTKQKTISKPRKTLKTRTAKWNEQNTLRNSKRKKKFDKKKVGKQM
jgi:hypothetical protein